MAGSKVRAGRLIPKQFMRRERHAQPVRLTASFGSRVVDFAQILATFAASSTSLIADAEQARSMPQT